jgi:tRNA 2-thiouridine synthesizing protein A
MQGTETAPNRSLESVPPSPGAFPAADPEMPVPDRTLDLRGVSCPLPPLRTLRALKGMRTGQILEVWGTSTIGNHSAPFLARVLGDQLLRVVPDDGFVRLFYRRT